MDLFQVHEMSIAGIYFHWMVPVLFLGFSAGLLVKTILKKVGLLRHLFHQEMVVMALCFGFCSLFTLIYIRP